MNLGDIVLKKIDLSKQIILSKEIFRCPICHTHIKLDANSLKCENNHTFDIKGNGSVFLYNTSNMKDNKIYDKDLFVNRRSFINGHFYDELHNIISTIINDKYKNDVMVIDLGSGEGTHDNLIKNKLVSNANIIGFDLSKAGIDLGTDYLNNNILSIVGNLNDLPIEDKSIDVILNILSPSNEKEMKRVLKDDGIIIKVVPTINYLVELRNNFQIDEYKNELIINSNITNNFDVIDKITYTKTLSLNDDNYNNLIKMTPMLKKIDKDSAQKIDNITISLNIYIMK